MVTQDKVIFRSSNEYSHVTDLESWCRVRVQPCWSDHESLPYINEPFNDAESLALWRALGYTQTRFTGDMYDMRNPEPAWIEPLRWHFPWQHFSWSVYRMGPGSALPEHGDTYARFRELFSIGSGQHVYRAVVFLDHWQQGHYFDIEGQPIVDWLAGDAVIWRDDARHTAANIGKTNRYTLQITGVIDADTFM